MPTIVANEIEIYYEIHGEGQPLLLIAGLGYTHWQWHKMVPHLAERAQVIVFDNRGVGLTDKPNGPYTAQMLAADSAALLEELDIRRAAIMGHSMGGFVAQALALERPELVERLILASTNFGGPRHIPITEEAMAVLSDVSGDPIERFKRGIVVSTAPGFADDNPDVIEEWLAFRTQNPIEPGSYQAQMAVGLALLSEEAAFEKRLSQVEAPTLILFGAHDRVVPPANAELLHEKLPDSQVTIIGDAGHFFPIERPEEAANAVLHFMNER